ncbi:MAG: hypothetical protein K8T26_08400 [Lentisphaerae bacterium]|nr:hypothetical protein [Lentisphaerota bacterium]
MSGGALTWAGRRRGHVMACLRLAVLAGVCVRPASAQTGAVQVVLQEPWRAVFAGQEVTVHALIASDATRALRTRWRLSAEGRTLQRGDVASDLAPGASVAVPIALRMPDLNAGVSRDVVLEIQVAGDGGGGAPGAAAFRESFHVFSEDPFANRTEWLRGLKLAVFDPEHRTAEVLAAAGVPFDRLPSVDALAGLEDVTLLIGEGVSFDACRGLWEQVTARAAAGGRVLVLAPGGGTVPVPGAAGCPLVSPSAMAWRRADIISDLDKRLDAIGWPPTGVLPAQSFVLQAERGAVTFAVQQGASAWTWLDLRYVPAGRLVVCGFPVMTSWEHGPTPRYLLVHLLEYVQEHDRTQQGDLDEASHDR